MNVPPWLEITREVVTILAVPVTLVLAWVGFGAWRREHRGKSRYEVARQLLKSAMFYRDTLEAARSPFMSAQEQEGRAKREGETPDQTHHFDIIFAYNKRLAKVDESRRDMYLNRLDAEVLWPKEIPGLCKPFFQQHNKLIANLEGYFEVTKKTSVSESDTQFLLECEEVIYGRRKEDPFRDEVETALTRLSEFLRPYIQMK